jgi:hypothetical protein
MFFFKYRRGGCWLTDVVPFLLEDALQANGQAIQKLKTGICS